MNWSSPYPLRAAFSILWIALGLLQAWLTPVLGDEAYYAAYAERLAWGFFDHPPMVAVLAKLGGIFSSNSLGLRFLFILLSTATLLLLERLVQPRSPLRFYLVLTSIAILHAFGFLALPDVPLLFFGVLFLLLWRGYAAGKDNIGQVLALAFVIAGMLYSKYHAVLLIGTFPLIDRHVWRRRSFWLLILFSALLMLPHLLWQWSHHFPSISYHLFERSSQAYRPSFTLDYLWSQLIVFGPFTGLALLWFSFRPVESQNGFQHANRTIVTIFLLFFLFMSFKGRVEAHWTALMLPSLLVSAYPSIESPRIWSIWRWPIYVSLFLVLGARLALTPLASDIPMEELSGFHAQESRIRAIAENSKGDAVAFMNSYQQASLFKFYTGRPAFAWNNIMGRRDQYDLWADALRYNGSPVTVVANYPMPGTMALSETPYSGLIEQEGFVSYKGIQAAQLEFHHQEGKAMLSFMLHSEALKSHRRFYIPDDSRWSLHVFEGKKLKLESYLPVQGSLDVMEVYELTFADIELNPGQRVVLGIGQKDWPSIPLGSVRVALD